MKSRSTCRSFSDQRETKARCSLVIKWANPASQWIQQDSLTEKEPENQLSKRALRAAFPKWRSMRSDT